VSPDIFVTTLDAADLSLVLEMFRHPSYAPLTRFLAGELQRAIVVEPKDLPQDVVTMGARVRFKLDHSGETREAEATLVYPGLEDDLLGRISVLSPVGSALIGMREGETIAWNGLDGRQNGVTVLKVLYQSKVKGPDASHRFWPA
jgi:regulator of nucleoside diphosphate kinase